MNAAEVLHELEARGVELSVRDGKVHAKVPKGLAVEEVRKQLQAVKAHLVELLGENPAFERASNPCARCRDLEARGVVVLACSVCDRSIALTPQRPVLSNEEVRG